MISGEKPICQNPSLICSAVLTQHQLVTDSETYTGLEQHCTCRVSGVVDATLRKTPHMSAQCLSRSTA